MAEWLPSSDGGFPQKALVGGQTNDGTPFYVGRTSFNNAILPGGIDGDTWQIAVTSNNAVFHNRTFEFLAKPRTHKVRWRRAGRGDIPTDAIIGGVDEDGENLYIGRNLIVSSQIIGKIHPKLGLCFCPHNNTETWYEFYEILCFKPRNSHISQ